MKKNLTKNVLFHYFNGDKVTGANPNMKGNCSGLSGDCSWLSGDLDSCEITDEDRNNGIDINDLTSAE